MKCRVLKITENDWDAIYHLIDVALEFLEDDIRNGTRTAYGEDFKAFKRCEKRINRQINEKRQQRQKRLTR